MRRAPCKKRRRAREAAVRLPRARVRRLASCGRHVCACSLRVAASRGETHVRRHADEKAMAGGQHHVEVFAGRQTGWDFDGRVRRAGPLEQLVHLRGSHLRGSNQGERKRAAWRVAEGQRLGRCFSPNPVEARSAPALDGCRRTTRVSPFAGGLGARRSASARQESVSLGGRALQRREARVPNPNAPRRMPLATLAHGRSFRPQIPLPAPRQAQGCPSTPCGHTADMASPSLPARQAPERVATETLVR